MSARGQFLSIFCALIGAFKMAFADHLNQIKEALFRSSNLEYIVLVQPAVFANELKVAPCAATLYRLDREPVVNHVAPKYVPVWRAELINQVCPRGALVSDSGEYMITISDYLGDDRNANAVVCYDRKGQKMWSQNLAMMISPNVLSQIPGSSDSALWFLNGSFDLETKTLRLNIIVGGELEHLQTRPVTIKLEDGMVLEESK